MVIFGLGLLWKRASGAAAVVAAIGTFAFSVLFKFMMPEVPFLLRMGYVFIALVVLFITLSLLSKKTVRFETRCRKKIKDQKVKKGSLLERPEQPKRPGRTFAGWYVDEDCTERWDFETDTVEENMTLYAKWL